MTCMNSEPRCRRTLLALLALAAGAVAARGEEPAIPGIMLPKLTKVTPEMIARITDACPAEAPAKPGSARKILVFSRCENFTHHSISVAHEALRILGRKTGAWSVDVSYDYGVFDAAKLAAYDAVVLNNCQNMLLPEGAPRAALLDFVRKGKGIVAIHSAIDNFGEDDLTELRTMMGGCSAGHPWGHYLTWRFKVEERSHPVTAHLNPDGFSKKDAMFEFDTRTGRRNVRVLVSMDMSDPATAKDEKGKPRGFRTDGLNPVVWVRREGKGRVFVNCFGNNDEIFWDNSMLKLYLAGIQYAIGDLKADDAPVAGAAAKAPDTAEAKAPAPAQPKGTSAPRQETAPNGPIVPADGREDSGEAAAPRPSATSGLKARWWNNNSFNGDSVLVNVVNTFNPVVNSPSVPFPASRPPLGPEFVTARLTGQFIPKVSGEYKFVSNADDYVALWINGAEEIRPCGSARPEAGTARPAGGITRKSAKPRLLLSGRPRRVKKGVRTARSGIRSRGSKM